MRWVKVDELIDDLMELSKDGKGEYPISVAYTWRGETVLSNIHSWCINGKTIQLNEEEFIENVCNLEDTYNLSGSNDIEIRGVTTND